MFLGVCIAVREQDDKRLDALGKLDRLGVHADGSKAGEHRSRVLLSHSRELSKP